MDARPRALVTGASAGIGRAFAEQLAQAGYNLTIVARRRERLEALASELRDRHGTDVDVLVADLVRADELSVVEQRVAADDLVLLVNNAGFGAYGPFVGLDPDRADEQIRLHITALVRLTRAALPGMVARGDGAVINVSSMLAYSAGAPAAAPLPKRAVYAATKAFVNTFTEILQAELDGTGVRVQALCPATVRTEFQELVGTDLSRMPAGSVMEPDDVVRASLVALRLGDVVCVPFLDNPAVLSHGRDSAFGALVGARRDTVAPRYNSSPSNSV